MNDPLVQELRDAALQLISARDAWGETIHHPTLHAAQERTIDVLTRAALTLDAACQREQALQEALENLVTKVDAMTVHPSFRSVWTLAYVHGHRYDGPTIDQEMNAAKALIGRADRDPAVPGLTG